MVDEWKLKGSRRGRWQSAKTTLLNSKQSIVVFAVASGRVIAAVIDAGLPALEYQIIGPDGAGIRGSFKKTVPGSMGDVVDCIEDRLLDLGWKINPQGSFTYEHDQA